MQGIRRVVAVTGAEAEAAIADGEALAARLADAEGLAGPALDAAVTSLKQARRGALAWVLQAPPHQRGAG